MHTLPTLPFAYDALEPHIDAKTMEIHHTKHHQAYVDGLNKALEAYPDLQQRSVEDLLKQFNTLPADIQTAVKNHGGGHANHSLFWTLLSPTQQVLTEGALFDALTQTFGSVDSFMNTFADAAKTRFGSGWAWLVSSDTGLEVMSTPNQDSPLMEGKTPLLGLDVWEHAYYLKYQNKRPDYIQSFFNIIHWEKVRELYEASVK